MSSQTPSITIESEYIPALPNTGFEPLSTETIVFTLVFLIAVGVAAYPYVRKAFTALSR